MNEKKHKSSNRAADPGASNRKAKQAWQKVAKNFQVRLTLKHFAAYLKVVFDLELVS